MSQNKTAMQDDVERVARVYATTMGFSFDKQMPDQQELLLKGTAAAMAATLELAVKALRDEAQVWETMGGSLQANRFDRVADWLQQRANEVKEPSNG